MNESMCEWLYFTWFFFIFTISIDQVQVFVRYVWFTNLKLLFDNQHAYFIRGSPANPRTTKKKPKKQKTKKQKTKKQTTISALVIFYLLCQELIFNGSVSFIIYTLFKLFFYQFINKKNWIVSKLSLSTKARQTFCFKTPSLLPQVAISVHIPKI